MVLTVSLIKLLKKGRRQDSESHGGGAASPWRIAFFKWFNRLVMILVWADAIMMPLGMSSVLLIESRKAD